MDAQARRLARVGAVGIWRGAAMAAAALVCAGLIGACGSTSGPTTTADLDVTRVEHAIERSILSQRHLDSRVKCPAKVAQKPGRFACVATTLSVKKPHKEIKTPFLVTVHNGDGYVTDVGK